MNDSEFNGTAFFFSHLNDIMVRARKSNSNGLVWTVEQVARAISVLTRRLSLQCTLWSLFWP